MPSVLLLHGVHSSRDAWWRMLRDLTDIGVEVDALDLLGHGGRTTGPPPPWSLRDFADDVAARSGPVDLVVGHSLGALVALTLAAQRPDFARAVLLEDPPDGVGETREHVADRIERAVAAARADPAAAQAAILTENPAWATLDARHAVAARRAMDIEPVAAFLRDRSWDLLALVRDCPVPVHLLAAEGPASVLGESARKALFDALGTRAREVTSGHSVYRDRPGPWLVTVLAVLAGLERDQA